MSKIINLKAEEILDSRGDTTIRVYCELEGGPLGEASVASGKSTGAHEAKKIETSEAIQNVNSIILDAVKNQDFTQETLDQYLIELDGTPDKSKLGANAILGVSMAFARAFAKEEEIELYEYLGELAGVSNFALPTPAFNLINGGLHSNSGLDFQEFMIIPVGILGFQEKVNSVKQITEALRAILQEKNYGTDLGDEGGFAPKLEGNLEALDILCQAIQNAGYTFDQVKIGLDIASSSFYQNGEYIFKKPEGTKNKNDMLAMYSDIVENYPVISIEDPFAEEDWQGFADLTRELSRRVMIVGDDLTVTNISRINDAIAKQAVNAVLIKLNQIGTVTETLNAISLTKTTGWTPFISHRSGETMDTFIADLAVGTNSPFIKSGALSQKERLAKYDRLIEIESFITNNK